MRYLHQTKLRDHVFLQKLILIILVYLAIKAMLSTGSHLFGLLKQDSSIKAYLTDGRVYYESIISEDQCKQTTPNEMYEVLLSGDHNGFTLKVDEDLDDSISVQILQKTDVSVNLLHMSLQVVEDAPGALQKVLLAQASVVRERTAHIVAQEMRNAELERSNNTLLTSLEWTKKRELDSCKTELLTAACVVVNSKKAKIAALANSSSTVSFDS
jgi:hypothetical protein